MKIKSTAVIVCLAALSSGPNCAAAAIKIDSSYESKSIDTEEVTKASNPAATGSSSSSAALPDAPSASLAAESGSGGAVRGLGPNTRVRLKTDRFSAIAIAFTTGVGGFGVDVATPLATKLNMRGSFTFLNYDPSVTEQGFPIDGSIKLRTINAGVEIFPYCGSFHITPGVTMYNGNYAHATTSIPGGQTFTINDTDYVSDPTDPVHGTFDVTFGHKFAPSLTMGFGNMLRRDSHWSVPVDIGFEYIGQPKFTLNMQGSVCDAADGCTPVQQDPGTVANLQQQQTDINNDISPLRFYPIVKVGLSYRFGRIHEMSNWR
jgi:hypothetical protein